MTYRIKSKKKQFEEEVKWFSKMYGLPKSVVRKKLKKEGFIVS
jgi:hypothetical protein